MFACSRSSKDVSGIRVTRNPYVSGSVGISGVQEARPDRSASRNAMHCMITASAPGAAASGFDVLEDVDSSGKGMQEQHLAGTTATPANIAYHETIRR